MLLSNLLLFQGETADFNLVESLEVPWSPGVLKSAVSPLGEYRTLALAATLHKPFERFMAMRVWVRAFH
jgi:hypothetical protein